MVLSVGGDRRGGRELVLGGDLPWLVEDAGRGGVTCIQREVAWLPAQRAVDAVGRVRVAPVQDLAKQVREQVYHLTWHALVRGRGRVLLDRDRHIADVARR